MQFTAYLIFDGRCEEAFKFYERLLNGKIQAMVSAVGTPIEQQTPPERRNKILNARLVVDDGLLMGMDAPPERYQQPKGFFVSLEVKSVAEAERIFGALAEGGRVEMPLQQTFWAIPFAMLVDRFGTPWIINYSQAA